MYFRRGARCAFRSYTHAAEINKRSARARAADETRVKRRVRSAEYQILYHRWRRKNRREINLIRRREYIRPENRA